MGYHATTDISHYHQRIHRPGKNRSKSLSQHGIHVLSVQTSSLCNLVVSRVLCEKSVKAALAAHMATLQMSVCLVHSCLTERGWIIVGRIFFVYCRFRQKLFCIRAHRSCVGVIYCCAGCLSIISGA